jgi:hypothetical protein
MTDSPQPSRAASLVLGLAATALPFAQDPEEEAERWLRILCRHGEVSLILTSVGFVDAAREPWRPSGVEPGSLRTGSELPASTDRVAAVALQCAERRGARSVTSEDLLVAVMAVYERWFDLALERHGGNSDELRKLLGVDLRLPAAPLQP